MSAEDFHGECNAIGMSGNCGVECPVFLGGSCESVEEVLGSISATEIIEQYRFTENNIFLEGVVGSFLEGDKESEKILADIYIPRLKQEILTHQTVIKNTVRSEIIKILEISDDDLQIINWR